MVTRDLNQWVDQQLDQLSHCELQPVEVAVLDSGIDATHPDLAGKISEAVQIELIDGKARIVQTNLLGNSDLFGHGTAVASIITRLAPNARIVDVRVLGTDNNGAAAALIAGLKFAVERKSRIINMSLAVKADYAPQLWPLCELAYRQNQIVVAARRNMPLADEGFPAEFSSCVSVDRDRFTTPYRLRFNLNEIIEYTAQGEEVIVAARGGGYTTKTGTSFATPAVSGLCALLVGAHPELRPFEVKTILKAFSD